MQIRVFTIRALDADERSVEDLNTFLRKLPEGTYIFKLKELFVDRSKLLFTSNLTFANSPPVSSYRKTVFDVLIPC